MHKSIVIIIVVSLCSVTTVIGQVRSKCDLRSAADDAIKACSDLIRRNPRDAAALESRGFAYNHKGSQELALADYTSAIKIAPSANLYLRRAALFGLQDKYDEAIEDLTKAIELNPQSSTAHLLRGQSWLWGKGNQEKALLDLSKAISLDPNLKGAYETRSNLYFRQKQYAEALADYDAVIRLNPTPNDFSVRAAIHLVMGHADSAIADHLEAIKRVPAARRLYLNLAKAYLANGEPDKSIATYEWMLKSVRPEKALIDYEGRSYAYFHKGDYHAAASDLKIVTDNLRQLKGKDVPVFPFLYLYVAKGLIGENPSPEITAYLENFDAQSWPYPLIELHLGNRRPETVLAQAANDYERCEAAFFIGEFHHLRKEIDAAKVALESAAKNCGYATAERSLAVSELLRLKP